MVLDFVHGAVDGGHHTHIVSMGLCRHTVF